MLAIVSLSFIDSDYPYVELFLKLGYIMLLGFYYFKRTKKINYFYVTLLVFYGISSSLLVLEANYLTLGTLFLLANRFLYIVISRKALRTENYKKIITFLFVFFIPIVIIFPQLKSSLGSLTYPILIIGILSAIMCAFAFVNYFNKMTKRNGYFLLSMLLFVVADILMVYNQFINYNFIIVIIYTSIYYVSRYLVCEAMIEKKS